MSTSSQTKELEGMDQLRIINDPDNPEPKVNLANLYTKPKTRKWKDGYTWNELIKAIATESGYYPYEVKDILQSFVEVASEELANNRVVRLERFMQLEPKITVPRKFYNFATRRQEISESKMKILTSLSVALENKINPKQKETNESNETDEPASNSGSDSGA